ncbi:helix-turn-helix domain-containing protein [Amaricoccus sp.]|uniref:helix-turn-helix domain-containing protein n=1 Tax=Amaricoccus sp. TaxID=1872485 RepID=UPI0039E66071
MSLYALRVFITCCETRSFRQAGDRLRVQESSVSRRIRDLEAGLGTPLFFRRASGVIPPAALSDSLGIPNSADL